MQQNRLTLARARHETRDWVQKAGLVELLDDDRATLLGALPEIASWLQENELQEEATDLKTPWRRRGLRAFDADNVAVAE